MLACEWLACSSNCQDYSELQAPFRLGMVSCVLELCNMQHHQLAVLLCCRLCFPASLASRPLSRWLLGAHVHCLCLYQLMFHSSSPAQIHPIIPQLQIDVLCPLLVLACRCSWPLYGTGPSWRNFLGWLGHKPRGVKGGRHAARKHHLDAVHEDDRRQAAGGLLWAAGGQWCLGNSVKTLSRKGMAKACGDVPIFSRYVGHGCVQGMHQWVSAHLMVHASCAILSCHSNHPSEGVINNKFHWVVCCWLVVCIPATAAASMASGM